MRVKRSAETSAASLVYSFDVGFRTELERHKLLRPQPHTVGDVVLGNDEGPCRRRRGRKRQIALVLPSPAVVPWSHRQICEKVRNRSIGVRAGEGAYLPQTDG